MGDARGRQDFLDRFVPTCQTDAVVPQGRDLYDEIDVVTRSPNHAKFRPEDP
jgi:hypothetical protein